MKTLERIRILTFSTNKQTGVTARRDSFFISSRLMSFQVSFSLVSKKDYINFQAETKKRWLIWNRQRTKIRRTDDITLIKLLCCSILGKVIAIKKSGVEEKEWIVGCKIALHIIFISNIISYFLFSLLQLIKLRRNYSYDMEIKSMCRAVRY